MPTRDRRRTILIILTLIPLAAAGCQLGPAALKVSQAQYNDAIQQTSAEQLLLNLVRLMYRESPMFLEVGSVSAQFVFDQSVDLSGTLNENIGAQRGNPGSLSIGGSFGYAERPTITYAPLSGGDFVQRLLSPISVESVIMLTHSGWSVDRVFSLAVQEMNGLDNAGMASGPTPALAPDTSAFARCAELLRALQLDRRLTLEYEDRATPVSDPLPAYLITADAWIAASAAGARFRATEDGAAYVLTRTSPALILRFANGAAGSADAAELRRILGLSPDQSRYDLVLGRKTGGGDTDAQGHHANIALHTRSLLGVMFYLSQAVDVPPDHRERNLVTNTVDAAGLPFDWSRVLGDVFKVHSRKTHPDGAYIAVQHRGYWFYIRDDDLATKSTFALLGQLFTLQAGGAVGITPVLTLPVGG